MVLLFGNRKQYKAYSYGYNFFATGLSIKTVKAKLNELKQAGQNLLTQGTEKFNLQTGAILEGNNFTLSLAYSYYTGFRYSITDNTGADVTGHSNNYVISQHLGLDELVPLSIVNILLSSNSNHANEIISELKKNNLADKVLNVYYRIKRNVEYIARGKESLYSITPNYPHTSNFFINSRW